ncbi:MAG TPA: hypothetical protein VHB30_01265 [Solirubrobacteraceae bacterium]|nr:hypothetical protein [Solirubrobacteraceae bacterium]
MHRGIPVTSVARTLLDLAGLLPLGELEAAVASALRRPGFDAGRVEDMVRRGRGHRGVGRLAALVAAEPKVTRSALERRFLALVRRAGLPEPETNTWITLGAGEEWQLDALWRAQRVSVELDGWESHRTRRQFERDRLRSAAMQAAGYRHVQLTWRQVTDEAPTVIRTLRILLGGGGRG